jgi:hypothetical protein
MVLIIIYFPAGIKTSMDFSEQDSITHVLSFPVVVLVNYKKGGEGEVSSARNSSMVMKDG